MEFCTHCGALLPDNATICPSCGAAVAGAVPAPHLELAQPVADASANATPDAPQSPVPGSAASEPGSSAAAEPAAFQAPAQGTTNGSSEVPLYARSLAGEAPHAPNPPAYGNGGAGSVPPATAHMAPAAAPQPNPGVIPPQAPLTTGSYLVTLLLFLIPIAGFILQLVWSFDSNTHPERQKLARAYLIRGLILVAVEIVFAVLFFGVFLAAISPLLYY